MNRLSSLTLTLAKAAFFNTQLRATVEAQELCYAMTHQSLPEAQSLLKEGQLLLCLQTFVDCPGHWWAIHIKMEIL